MNSFNVRLLRLLVFIPFILLLTSCTAGNEMFSQENPAGFWYGLWHGIISVVCLVIHVFNESVAVYEVNNTSGWYDFGFVLGIIMIWSGGSHANCNSRAKKQSEKEWEELGEKIEKKVMRKLKDWVADEEDSDSAGEWDEIGEKVEKKLKKKIREWAEKE